VLTPQWGLFFALAGSSALIAGSLYLGATEQVPQEPSLAEAPRSDLSSDE
jgi:hypothetical protein